MELVGAVICVPEQRCLQLQRFMKEGLPMPQMLRSIHHVTLYLTVLLASDDVNTLFLDYFWQFKDITQFSKIQLLPPKFQSMRSEFLFGNIVFNFCLKNTLPALMAVTPAIQHSCRMLVMFNICPRSLQMHGSNLQELNLE